jgi:hypothetical protein
MSNTEQAAIGGGDVRSSYGGMKRSHYLIFLVAFISLFIGFGLSEGFGTTPGGEMRKALGWVLTVPLIAFFVLSALRLKNIGYNMLWILAFFFPFANLFAAVICATYPGGYTNHGKFDSAAYILAAIILSLLVYGVYLFSSHAR